MEYQLHFIIKVLGGYVMATSLARPSKRRVMRLSDAPPGKRSFLRRVQEAWQPILGNPPPGEETVELASSTLGDTDPVNGGLQLAIGTGMIIQEGFASGIAASLPRWFTRVIVDCTPHNIPGAIQFGTQGSVFIYKPKNGLPLPRFLRPFIVRAFAEYIYNEHLDRGDRTRYSENCPRTHIPTELFGREVAAILFRNDHAQRQLSVLGPTVQHAAVRFGIAHEAFRRFLAP